MPATIIICKECGEEKLLHGRGMCSRCYRRQWMRDHYEERRPKMYEWRDKNHDRLLEKTKEWRDGNPELVRVRRRRYRKNNKEKLDTKNKEWREANRERHIQNALDWRKSNIERDRENQRRATNRRRAREEKLECSLTMEDWNEILEEFDYRCAYCGKKAKKLEQEHVIPVSNGGGYTRNNIVPACRPCNSSKQDEDVFVFMDRKGYSISSTLASRIK